MWKKMRKPVVILLTVNMLTALVAFSNNPVQAEETGGMTPYTEEGGYDYEFSLSGPKQNVSFLDDAFDAYKFNNATSPEAAKAVTGPKTPSEIDPSTGTNKMPYFTAQYFGSNTRGYLKPTHVLSGGFSALTYKSSVFEEFEAEYEMFGTYSIFGIAFGGEAGVFPISKNNDSGDDKGVVVYMENDGKLSIGGTIDKDTVGTTDGITVVGEQGNLKGTTNLRTSSLTEGESIAVVAYPDDTTPTHTICMRVKDRLLTVWEKAHPDKTVSVELTDQYTGGAVSLIANQTNHGAFKSFRIKSLSGAYDDYAVYQSLDAGAYEGLSDKFISYQFDTNTGKAVVENGVVPSTYWNVNGENQTGDFKVPGWLIPNHRQSAKKLTTLTLKDKIVRNFEAGYTFMPNYTGYGIMVAPEGQLVDDIYGLGLQMYISSDGMILLKGAYDKESVQRVGEGWDGTKLRGFVAPQAWNADNNKTAYTVHVSVNNGEIKIWLDQYEGSYFSAKLTAGYSGGALSVFSTGCDQGGFQNFFVKEYLPDPEVEKAVITVRKENTGDYTAVTIYADGAADSKYMAEITYDSAKYTYVGTRLEASAVPHRYPAVIEEDGGLKLSLITNRIGKQAVLIFKNDTLVPETTAFEFGGSLQGIGGVSMEIEKWNALYGDVTGDNTVDVRDLVRLKKYAQDNTVHIEEINSNLDDSGVYTSDRNLTLMRKAVLGIGNTEIGSLTGKTGLFLGDSIAYGAGDPYRLSWAGRIARRGMLYENVAVSGWALTNTDTSKRGQIVTQLDQAKKDAYDLVVLEGGVNDVLIAQNTSNGIDIEWGSIVEDPDAGSYDDSTIAGAMQELIVKTQEKFGSAVIVYVINSYFGASDENMTTYIQLVKEVCAVHGISYIDLNDTVSYPTMEALSKNNENLKEYLPDNLHPNAAGYEIISEVMGDYLERLLKND